jgi:phosphoglycolate phosphatase
MARYRLLIFDFDGTLADSAAWFFAKYNQLAEELGLRQVTAAELQMLRDHTTREILAFLKVPLWKVPMIASRMRAHAGAEAEQIKLFPGVDELLVTLKGRGFTLAVVSSNSAENVRRILGPANAACFDAFDCSASILGKARHLRAVMKHTGIPPEHTLCIGDEARDVDAARKVGADAGAVLWGYASAAALERAKPTRIFRTLDELAALTP